MNNNDDILNKDEWFDEIDIDKFALNDQRNNRHSSIAKKKVNVTNGKDLTSESVNSLTKCPLVVSQKPRDKFQERVLYEDANSLMLTLKFSEVIQVRGSTDAI